VAVDIKHNSNNQVHQDQEESGVFGKVFGGWWLVCVEGMKENSQDKTRQRGRFVVGVADITSKHASQLLTSASRR
jgi:hypothetical protein